MFQCFRKHHLIFLLYDSCCTLSNDMVLFSFCRVLSLPAPRPRSVPLVIHHRHQDPFLCSRFSPLFPFFACIPTFPSFPAFES
jgi:hypothetical protein